MDIEANKLRTIMRQRLALTQLRSEVSLSRTDIEILAYAKAEDGLFTVYGLKKYYSSTNIQQLRRGVTRLTKGDILQLVSGGTRNSPATYWLSNKGQQVLNQYLSMI